MIELISIHIPKTGGRSIRRILRNIYGDSLDLRHEREHFFPEGTHAPPLEIDFPEDIRAIHAHLSITQFMPVIKEYQPKVITWIRNPVDRVISNYYFFMLRIRENKVEKKQLSKKNYSLLEYAAETRKGNKMATFLEGMDISDFYFIGILEQIGADVNKLVSMMGWPKNVKIIHINSNYKFKHNNDCTTQYKDINEKIRHEIALLNQEDIELYHEVKKMRGIV
ncbi:MAG: sulfotransferase family 2 domain-containing protein [Bacteroidales bacterium]|nr:sulfotransferase family 2 domain-containing protein [Bacteroidales bacterium]